MRETTYSDARANFAKLLDAAVDDREVVIVKRRKGPSAAIIAADELSSLLETEHLLRSPENARRLLAALERSRAGKIKAMSIEQLKKAVGFEES